MRKAALVGLSAAALMIIATFLGYAEIMGTKLSFWNLPLIGKGRAIIVIVFGLLTALFAFLSNTKHLNGIGSLIFGILGLMIALMWMADIGKAGEAGKVGIGVYAFLLGAILALVSGVLAFMKK
jgi:hypothetical protein